VVGQRDALEPRGLGLAGNVKDLRDVFEHDREPMVQRCGLHGETIDPGGSGSRKRVLLTR
jgi:hypothetical protein